MKFTKHLFIGLVFVAFIVALTSGNILEKSDAAQSTPEHLQLKIFADYVNELSETELVLLVDSLLSLSSVPPMYFQVVNSKIEEYANVNRKDNPYPAHQHYKSWNTKKSHPYPESLSKKDSVLSLCLTDNDWNCNYSNPFQSYITSEFGWRGGKMHNGVDIALLVGDTVRSAFEGVVRLARWQGGYGRTVIVRHYNGLETIYGHLSRYLVKEGQHVDPGTPIAKGGNSGASRGSHLHFETRFKGKPINPASFIDFDKGEVKHDTLILKKLRYGYIGYQPGGAYHKVRRGDYMYKIANQYGVSIKQICQLNGIRRNHFLVVGEELKVSN